MKKYLIGGVIGFLAAPLAGLLFLYIQLGPTSALYWLYDWNATISASLEELPEDAEYYSELGNSYGTFYEVKSTFMDDFSISPKYHRLGFYLLDPVVEFQKEDYRSVCIQSFDLDTWRMNVAITLGKEARNTLATSFSQSSSSYFHPLMQDVYQKRYVIEAETDLIKTFWVSGDGALKYRDAVENAPDEPDFILSVPLDQLLSFQRYLAEGMLDAPPTGCTPDIDPTRLPGWAVVVLPYWKNWEEQQREENDSPY